MSWYCRRDRRPGARPLGTIRQAALKERKAILVLGPRLKKHSPPMPPPKLKLKMQKRDPFRPHNFFIAAAVSLAATLFPALV
jgi:hypothetical protein